MGIDHIRLRVIAVSQGLAEMQRIVFVLTIFLVSLSARAGITVVILASGQTYRLCGASVIAIAIVDGLYRRPIATMP